MPRKKRTKSKLISAIEDNNLDELKRLVRKGMKLNWMIRPRNVLPLVLAAQTGDIDFCRAIVELGACLHACRGLPSPLNNAIYLNFETAVKVLIGLGCDVNECCLEKLWSEKTLVKWKTFLMKSAKPFLSRPTSLSLAILMDNCDVATILLEAGADINKSSEEDERGFGKTPIHYLCENLWGRCNLAQILEYVRLRPHLNPKPDLNRLNNDGETPLMVAAKCGNTEAVHTLIEEKVDLNCETENNSTALHYAVGISAGELDFLDYRSVDTAVALLRAGCAVEMPHWKDSILNVKTYMVDEMCEVLVKFGADPLRYNGDWDTLLHLGVSCGNIILIDMVLRAGISVDVESSRERKTPLMGCISCLTTAQHLIEQQRARLDMRDSNGYTALHHCLRSGASGVCAYLIIEGSPRYLESYHLAERKPRILELLLLTEPSLIRALMSTYAVTWPLRWTESLLYQLGHVMASNALSLKHLCRLAIRDALAKHSEGRGIRLAIEYLPLPVYLKKYICYHEELDQLKLSTILDSNDDGDDSFDLYDKTVGCSSNYLRYHRHRQRERPYDQSD